MNNFLRILSIFLCLSVMNFAQELENSPSVINKNIAKNKSGFTFGIGLNYINLLNDKNLTHKYNATTLIGYSYFFDKNIGFRVNIFIDNSKLGFYTGGEINLIYDIFQESKYGFGILTGINFGVKKIYKREIQKNIISANAGFSLIFDGGINRIQFLFRYPIKPIRSGILHENFSYILMYSYVF